MALLASLYLETKAIGGEAEAKRPSDLTAAALTARRL
jgi:hypothetical protein